MSTQIRQFSAKSPEASRLRQRKYALVREFGLPEDLLGGRLLVSQRRCGKQRCHCAKDGRGHAQRLLCSSRHGARQVERIPALWVEELERVVQQTQDYLTAVREVMAINLQLLRLARVQMRHAEVRRRAKIAARDATNDQLSAAELDQ